MRLCSPCACVQSAPVSAKVASPANQKRERRRRQKQVAALTRGEQGRLWWEPNAAYETTRDSWWRTTTTSCYTQTLERGARSTQTGKSRKTGHWLRGARRRISLSSLFVCVCLWPAKWLWLRRPSSKACKTAMSQRAKEGDKQREREREPSQN